MLVVVWKRADIRETSRLLTFLSAERGRFTALSKGAHRPNSATLGKLDFLNRCEVTLSGRGFPLLGRVQLVHEPRALRQPRRFHVATHLADLFDRAFVPEQADRVMFDLLLGALTLTERAELRRLPSIVCAIELRLLSALGVLGDLTRCGSCGEALSAEAGSRASVREPGLRCERHRESGDLELAPEIGAILRELVAMPGRLLPTLEPPVSMGAALAVCGRWIEAGLEHRPRFRALALSTTDGIFPKAAPSAGMHP